jgi:predicted ABC-type ATPase
MTARPRIFIIAGPNGAGKTTFAREFLPNEASCPAFVNADLIAAGLSPFKPEAAAVAAGRIMLAQIAAHVRRGESFAFETTLSGRAHARHIPHWRHAGYDVNLWFLRLPNPEAAIARVRQRVLEGGHDVAESVIRRRFDAGLRNFERVYKPVVDRWILYDNSGRVPVLLDEGGRNRRTP